MGVPDASLLPASVAPHRLVSGFESIDWPALALHWSGRVAGAFLLLVIGMWLSKRISRALALLLERFEVDRILTTFLGNIANAIGMIVVFIATLDYLGVPTTSLLAVVGAAGLGIGLALKDSLSNIASGVMLTLLRPFRAGDEVQIATLNGVVDQVRIFQTVLRTYDNRVIILPNSLITSAPITNFTARDRRRVDLPIAIGLDDPIGTARDLLLAAARANARVLRDPAPDVLVSALTDNGVTLALRAWVATRDYANAKSELLEAARAALGGGGIGTPRQALQVFHHAGDASDAQRRIVEAAPPPGAAAASANEGAEGVGTPES